MAVLCEMPTLQYSARRAWLSLHKLFTSGIPRGPVSRDSIGHGDWLPARLRLSDVRVICRFVNARRTSQKIWRGFLYGVNRPGEWL